MKETHYAYAVAYMKTFENKMLTSGELETLLNTDDMGQALKILSDKGFGQNVKGNEGVSGVLKSELEKIWSEAKNVCPEGAPLDVLLYKNDFHNLKTVLKAAVSGTEFENMLFRPCLADPYEFENAIKTASFEELPEFIKEAAEKAYEIITQTRDGQMAEVYLDRACLEQMKKRAENEKNEFLDGWVDLNVLIADMKIAARAVGRTKDFIKGAMVEAQYSEKLTEASLKSKADVVSAIAEMGYAQGAELLEKSFSDFEKWCDNLKMDYIKKAKMKSFGFEPILAFLIGKEFELQAVRIILSGKENGVPAEIIKERLRDMYV